MEAFKAEMLNLWILINDSNVSTSQYIQKFQNNLNTHFQINEFVYYNIKRHTVKRLPNSSNEFARHEFSLAELMPYIEKRHLHPNPLLMNNPQKKREKTLYF